MAKFTPIWPRLFLILILVAATVSGCGRDGQGEKVRKPDGGQLEAKSDAVPAFAPVLSDIANVRHIAVSPDGKLVAAVSWGRGEVGIWDFASGKAKIKKIPANCEALAFTHDSKKLIGIASEDDKILIWDAASGKELASAKLPPWRREDGGPDQIQWAHFLTLSADGKYAMSTHNATRTIKFRISDAKIDLFDGDVEQCGTCGAAYCPSLDLVVIGTATTGVGGALSFEKPGEKKGSARKIPVNETPSQIEFSGDGKTMAVLFGWRGRVELCDTTTWKVRLGIPSASWNHMAISGDGRFLAGILENHGETTVELWDTRTETNRVVDKGGRASFVTFTPNGNSLLIGYKDAGIKQFNVGK